MEFVAPECSYKYLGIDAVESLRFVCGGETVIFRQFEASSELSDLGLGYEESAFEDNQA
jgi:hypothetical protein